MHLGFFRPCWATLGFHICHNIPCCRLSNAKRAASSSPETIVSFHGAVVCGCAGLSLGLVLTPALRFALAKAGYSDGVPGTPLRVRPHRDARHGIKTSSTILPHRL
jgi:hypothetical protein